MILAAASALEANKHQDQLAKTHVYFPFLYWKHLEGGGKKNHIKGSEMDAFSWQIWQKDIVFFLSPEFHIPADRIKNFNRSQQLLIEAW